MVFHDFENTEKPTQYRGQVVQQETQGRNWSGAMCARRRKVKTDCAAALQNSERLSEVALHSIEISQVLENVTREHRAGATVRFRNGWIGDAVKDDIRCPRTKKIFGELDLIVGNVQGVDSLEGCCKLRSHATGATPDFYACSSFEAEVFPMPQHVSKVGRS